MDFTLKTYSELLNVLKERGYRFITFGQYCAEKNGLSDVPFVILRHDVDLKAENSLATAKLEHEKGITASYYFRVVPESNKPEIIKAIVDLGHEIGYHYEDMTVCEGDAGKAIVHFEKQLAYFRQYYPVRTVCMHGSPRSKYDGRDLWKHYDYHNYGIIGEPYFDVDFSKVFYLTDTGRRWDGFNVSVRDKVPVYQDEWIRQGLVFRSTDDIIASVVKECFPMRLMMTTHPQRWEVHFVPWMFELTSQRIKNVVKKQMISSK